MPKQKTHSGAKKRFKLTGTGKLLRRRAMRATCSRRSRQSVSAVRQGRPGREGRRQGQELLGRASDAAREAIRPRAQEAPQGPRAGEGLLGAQAVELPLREGAGRALARLRLPRPQEQEAHLPPALDHAHQRRGAADGLSYNQFVAGCRKAGIELDRKMLADLAVSTRPRSGRSPSRRKPRSKAAPQPTARRSRCRSGRADGRVAAVGQLRRRFAEHAAEELARRARCSRWRVPLQLLGGLHYLVLAEPRPDGTRRAEAEEFLRGFVREQTRPDERGAALVGAAARASCGPRGCSGGRLRRRRARSERRAEPGVGRLPLRVRRGSRARSGRALVVGRGALAASRAALDVGRPSAPRRHRPGPIDVTTDEGARLLESFVWAGQDERLERLRRAIDVVRANPPELVRGDLARELPNVFRRPADASCSRRRLPYVSARRAPQCERRSRMLRTGCLRRRRAAARRPWVGLRLARYPGGERELVAHTDFHGAWLECTL